jgi:heme A synthase
MRTLPPFARYAWGVLAYNLAVVAWGAFVRATGSGAGCGAHWPLCNGTVVPRAAQVATMIEFAHRASSGVALLLVVGLLVWALRAHPEGHPARTGAKFSMGLMLLEAALGAGLVLFELVAHNASLTRAFSMAAHLANTFLLLGALTLTAWWGSGGAPLVRRGRRGTVALAGSALAGVLLVGVSGAIAALGDTLYAGGRVAEGVTPEGARIVELLIELRLLHPALAILVAALVLFVTRTLFERHQTPAVRRLAPAAALLVLAQLGLGWLNVQLLAPVWMQLVHLLAADLVWISLVLLAAAALAGEERESSASPAANARGELAHT